MDGISRIGCFVLRRIWRAIKFISTNIWTTKPIDPSFQRATIGWFCSPNKSIVHNFAHFNVHGTNKFKLIHSLTETIIEKFREQNSIETLLNKIELNPATKLAWNMRCLLESNIHSAVYNLKIRHRQWKSPHKIMIRDNHFWISN